MRVKWILHEGPQPKEWSWRAIGPDGAITRMSPVFKDYGAMVHDAINSGFRPAREHWVVVTRHGVTHFEPGIFPLSVPGDGATPRVRKPLDLEKLRKASIERAALPRRSHVR